MILNNSSNGGSDLVLVTTKIMKSIYSIYFKVVLLDKDEIKIFENFEHTLILIRFRGFQLSLPNTICIGLF
jgi:hypothetical protein